MPFTFAHPAAVIPLHQRFPKLFSLTALVLGSMAPDFEYFMRLRTVSTISHTLAGVFLFDLPLVILLAYMCHGIVKRPFLLMLPAPWDGYFAGQANQKWRLGSARDVLVFLYSALFGILTHVGWDAFTHKDGFFATRIPRLSETIPALGYHVPVYKILQHGSTLLGFFIIGAYLYVANNGKHKGNIPLRMKLRYWGGVLGLTVLFIIVVFVFSENHISLSTLGKYVVTSITGFMISLVMVSLWVRFKSMSFSTRG